MTTFNTAIATVSSSSAAAVYRSEELQSMGCSRKGKAARKRRLARRETKREIKEAQILKIQVLALLGLDLELEVQEEEALPQAVETKPGLWGKVWGVLNTPITAEAVGVASVGAAIAAIAAVTTMAVMPPSPKAYSFGERKHSPTLVRFLTELRKAHNSVQQ